MSRSELRFEGSFDATLIQDSLAGSFEVRATDALTLMVSGGAVVGGTMRAGGRSFDVRPGPVVAVGASQRIVDGRGRAPFVLLSLTASQSFLTTDPGVPLRATDVRLGATIGKTIGPLTPFAVARVFGGPVRWTLDGNDVTGSDRGHYQLGIGGAIAKGAFDAFVEWDWLGERRVTAGIGVAF